MVEESPRALIFFLDSDVDPGRSETGREWNKVTSRCRNQRRGRLVFRPKRTTVPPLCDVGPTYARDSIPWAWPDGITETRMMGEAQVAAPPTRHSHGRSLVAPAAATAAASQQRYPLVFLICPSRFCLFVGHGRKMNQGPFRTAYDKNPGAQSRQRALWRDGPMGRWRGDAAKERSRTHQHLRRYTTTTHIRTHTAPLNTTLSGDLRLTPVPLSSRPPPASQRSSPASCACPQPQTLLVPRRSVPRGPEDPAEAASSGDGGRAHTCRGTRPRPRVAPPPVQVGRRGR